ncbi:MAG: M48 family metalloprotease [Alphaproteobacteria bacterium]
MWLIALLLMPAGVTGAAARGGFSFIRDAEIENTIRLYGAPLFAAAGLSPDAVRVHLINDKGLNAFVAGGQNIFINTGLLMAADTPNQVIGVIAHETGHIAGGHLARSLDAIQDASAQSLLAFLLGAAVMVGGGGAAGGAIIAGGTQVAQRSFLQYSRTQESAADQAGLRFLDETQQSGIGLYGFLEKLGDQEALLATSQDPYVRTHPLTRERLAAIKFHVDKSPYTGKTDPPALVARHDRMVAKLHGFLDSPAQTMKRYPESDTSVPARYARSVAHHQRREDDKAVALVDSLLAEQPDDPFFHELRGQILLESGRIDDAVPSYQRAVELAPNEALLRVGLGQAQVSVQSDRYVKDAIENLNAAIRVDRSNIGAWRWLAMAYGRDDQIGEASLATAERYMLAGRFREAGGQADRATKLLPAGSPGALRAEDIKQAAESAQKKREDR